MTIHIFEMKSHIETMNWKDDCYENEFRERRMYMFVEVEKIKNTQSNIFEWNKRMKPKNERENNDKSLHH